MAKKKVNRTEEARRGTKADPDRIEEQRKAEAQRELERQMAAAELANGPKWYIEPLDVNDLDKKESLTKSLFTTTEMLLCLIIFVLIAGIVLEMDELTFASFRSLITDEPAYVMDIVTSCLQILAAAIVGSCYKHYADGDVGYAEYNLVLLLISEIAMQSVVGIVCCGVLIWRTWKRCSVGLSDWSIYRGIGGKLADLAPSIVLTLASFICLYLESGL